MNHAKKFAVIALAALIHTGCASMGGDGASATADLGTYQKAAKEANTAIKMAVQANNVWRDSRKILDKAEKLAKSGDFEKATKMALKAKRQGELALAQAKAQEGAGPIQ